MSASKNQRSGPKAAQKVIRCPQGHEMRHARMASRGRMLMILVCDCDFPAIAKGGSNG
jgi:hypothetical protein